MSPFWKGKLYIIIIKQELENYTIHNKFKITNASMRYENSRLGLKYIVTVWERFRESISIPSNNNSSPNIEKDLWMFL